MGKKPHFIILENTPDRLLIQDVGPWDVHLTVTNGAEMVIEDLLRAGHLNNRSEVEYIDTDGEHDLLLVRDDKFAGYAPMHP